MKLCPVAVETSKTAGPKQSSPTSKTLEGQDAQGQGHEEGEDAEGADNLEAFDQDAEDSRIRPIGNTHIHPNNAHLLWKVGVLIYHRHRCSAPVWL